MVNIAPVPIILNDMVLQIAADNYEASVSKAQLDPTTPTTTWRGLTPAAIYQLAGTPVWALSLDYAQDHVTANSLSQYLQTNAGQQKTVMLKPKKPSTTGPTYTIDVIIVPGPIGGQVDTIAVGSVTLPAIGQPIRTVA